MYEEHKRKKDGLLLKHLYDTINLCKGELTKIKSS